MNQQAPYPYHTYYPYSGYAPWYPPAVRPVLPPTPAERTPRPGTVRAISVILAAIATVATVGALILAAIAPTLAQREPAPTSGGLSVVYAADLHDDPTDWDIANGCVFEQGGLHATLQSGPTLCEFMPSGTNDLTSGGFFLTTTVGSAAAVSGQQEPCIVLSSDGDIYSLVFDQSGRYVFAANPSQTCELKSATGTLLEAVAWHADGYTPNEIGLRYDPGIHALTVYTNGQQVFRAQLGLSGAHKISLGAAGGGEAVFTSFALYSGAASAS